MVQPRVRRTGVYKQLDRSPAANTIQRQATSAIVARFIDLVIHFLSITYYTAASCRELLEQVAGCSRVL